MMVDTVPLVSIGMPVYNGARFIREALDSILAQTFGDFELIISDNGSTDDTELICRAYAQRDGRIRYFRNERNMGASYNYNRVTELSRGRYIRHAAHDDVLAPTNIERCVEVLEADPSIVLAYPQMARIDENGVEIDLFTDSLDLPQEDPVARWRRFHDLLDDGSMCDPVFGLFRASALRATRVLTRCIGADMILLAEIALRGRIKEIRQVLFFERWHPGTSVNANRTADDRVAWFDPARRGRWSNHLPQWVWLAEYLRAVQLAPLSPLQKASCTLSMARWMLRNKRGLVLGPLALCMRFIGFEQLALRTTSRYL